MLNNGSITVFIDLFAAESLIVIFLPPKWIARLVFASFNLVSVSLLYFPSVTIAFYKISMQAYLY